MKSPFLLFSLTIAVGVAMAADPLTEAFQRGLLAEESQRDLKAAAAAYDEVVGQADAQRELVATALFRRAEAQRRLGRTNEAMADYRRLVREFADQTNLTGLAVARLPEGLAEGPGVQLLVAQLEKAGQVLARTSREHAELAGFLRQSRALASLAEKSSAVAARYPSAELQRLRAERSSAEVALARLTPDFAAQHPDVIRNKSVLAKLDEQLEREVAGILDALEVREKSLGADVESQSRGVSLLEARLRQERQDESQAVQGKGPDLAGLSQLRNNLALLESERGEAVEKYNRLTEVATVVAAVKPSQVAAQMQPAPELVELVTEGKTLTERRDSLEAEAAELEGKLGSDDAKVRELRRELTKQDESLEVLRRRAMAACQVRLQSLGSTVKSMDARIETLREELRQAETEALLSARPADPADEARRLLAEEIRLADEQVAEIRRQVANGKVTQAELLKVQRDVLTLKRQFALLSKPDLVDVLPGTGAETVAEADEESREIERLRRMLANSPDLVNAPQGEAKETPLQTAARLDQARVVEFLLAQKADLNVPVGGRTPLHLAAGAGRKRMVELLLKAGAKVDAQADDGQTPLHLAVASGHRQVVQALLAAGANLTLKTKSGPNILTDHGQVAQVTPLGLAVMCRSGALIEQLAEAGANLDEPAGATSPQVGPVSPLMLACLSHDFVTAGKVLELGANPGSDVKGRVPLSLAIGLGAPLGFMEQLVKQGAPLAWTGDEGETLLHLAVRSEHEGAVAWLLKRGLNPDSQDAEGNSVLLVAVNRVVEQRGRGWSPTDKPSGAQAVVDLLMQAKANPNLANREGITPLWQAATSGQVELTQRLLTAGGNPNQSRPGHGPVAFAVLDAVLNLPRQGVRAARSPAESAEVSRSGHSILQALLEAGADPNLPGRNGYRLLNFAISAGPQWVQVLLKHRADPNQRSPDDGATPLETIQSSRQLAGSPDLALTVESLQECERLLRAAGARDEVPNFRVIRVARKSSGFSQVVFRSGGTNDPNRFTLLELLAVHHGAILAPEAFRAEPGRPEQPVARSGPMGRPLGVRNVQGMLDPGLGFTDWRRVVIYRPAAAGLERRELPVDVEALVAAGDCGRDMPLEWGDVVELPEREHAVDAPAEGRPPRIELLWATCLTRTVNVSVKGESRTVKLAWGGSPSTNPFTLETALRQPGLLRTSSDVRHLRVERAGPEGTRTWPLDGSDGLAKAGFVLRGGDVIVVPDLPAGGK